MTYKTADHSARPGPDGISRRGMLIGSAIAGAAIAAPLARAAAPRPKNQVQRDIDFDTGWRFRLGDLPDAAQPGHDDSGWRTLDLPHDWSIEDRPGAPSQADGWQPPQALWNSTPRAESATTLLPDIPIVIPQLLPEVPGGPPHRIGPFDTAASAGGWTTGWTVGGVGWYRKTFALPGLVPGEQVEIRFDGIYQEAQIWINGVAVGRNINGYMGFAFDLTPHLRADGLNTLAIRVANDGDNSRWYSGSGIYRHVWLSRTGAVRVPLWGVTIETVEANAESAKIVATVELENRVPTASSATCRVAIRDARGTTITSGHADISLVDHSTGRVEIPLAVARPALWSPEAPHLHAAEITIETGDAVTDRLTQRFGIRTLALAPKTGFRINGKSYKLKGACLHHDNGLLGAVAIDAAERRKVELMKANGFNAIRCSHNPFSPHFLDVCDELGMIVVDEAFDAWEKEKRKYDYHLHFPEHWREDLGAMIRRDRNHPSIAFWSIGNEIPEITTPRGSELAGQLRDRVLELDRTRFVTPALTQAHQGPGGEPARRHLDVSGYNYMYQAAVRDRDLDPNKVFMNSESYGKDIHAIWQDVEKYPWILGDFLWTGMDYLGEVGLGSSRLLPLPPPAQRNFLDIFLWDYPAFQSGCGDLDILGRKKPQGFYRDVVWGRSPLELLVQRPTPPGTYEDVSDWGWHDELASWSWAGHEGKPLTVRAYTAGDEVTLLLDGQEVAHKRMTPDDRMTAEMEVPYHPGELVAVASVGGREIGRKRLLTAGPAHRIQLRAEQGRIGRGHGALAYVFAEIQDQAGVPVPDAAVPITFAVEGAGRLAAAGSANPFGVESLRDESCMTFCGIALAIVSPTGRRGDIRIRATSPSLANGSTIVQVA